MSVVVPSTLVYSSNSIAPLLRSIYQWAHTCQWGPFYESMQSLQAAFSNWVQLLQQRGSHWLFVSRVLRFKTGVYLSLQSCRSITRWKWNHQKPCMNMCINNGHGFVTSSVPLNQHCIHQKRRGQHPLEEFPSGT